MKETPPPFRMVRSTSVSAFTGPSPVWNVRPSLLAETTKLAKCQSSSIANSPPLSSA